MKHIPTTLLHIAVLLCSGSCNVKPTAAVIDKASIKSEIERILKIQEDAYDQHDEEGRATLAATCHDSLLFIGGDDGGQATSAQFYVHDLADGYSQRPSERTYRIFEKTVIVTSVHQSFKVFDHDTIYFNARSTKVFVNDNGSWKMAYTTYAPLPVMYLARRKVDPDLLRDYAGLYRSGPAAADTFTVVGDRIFTGRHALEESELIPLNDSTFFSRAYFGKTIFTRNSIGDVKQYAYEFPDGQRLIFPKIKE